MTEYTEQAVLVDALWYCTTDGPCEYCPGYTEPLHCSGVGWTMSVAANMIESQFRLIEKLRREIAGKDKEIEDLTREIMTYPDEGVM